MRNRHAGISWASWLVRPLWRLTAPIHIGLALSVLIAGAWLFFALGSTYEGYELMVTGVGAVLCWPYFFSLFGFRMLIGSLILIVPVSLVCQGLAVHNGIWVYSSEVHYAFGLMHAYELEMPWMEVAFYFLFPFFQFGVFAFCCHLAPPDVNGRGKALPFLFKAVPGLFSVAVVWFWLRPWDTFPHPFDYNCAIMGTAFLVALLALVFSRPFRIFIRSRFFLVWVLAMVAYLVFWEQFHVIWHAHWRYDLGKGHLPPLHVAVAGVGSNGHGLGLSWAQPFGYFMTATVFPAIAFLVGRLPKAIRGDPGELKKIFS